MDDMIFDFYGEISIHPPRAGRDKDPPTMTTKYQNFNPPAPCGAGHGAFYQYQKTGYFNPPAPCGAGLLYALADKLGTGYFNPPAPCGAGLLAWLQFRLA